ncbi:isoamyl alcohol oxidase [Truncatella angustata]|uniref:Isoamyl alcohol oxidase n=1 Tax=Truncatella angustata TaxID=152316 RepID=A0A9P8UGA4_9PEZI|nr:isoamyl alcohol oxidase [Truncatella angustata]KAH6651605.1 isoamyl alcohol oxidase [Truncatella angustata]
MFSSAILIGALTLCFTLVQQSAAQLVGNLACKCIPGDECWPTVQDWVELNATIRGRLVTPSQLAAVCHNPNYDEATCNYVQKYWNQPELHDDSSSSVMAAAVANLSCDPFTVRELPCEPGNTVTYSVNASDASDIASAISFAREKDIRLVIRNTGHDYLGRSTGKWALSVWTHHMKSIEYIWYSSKFYNGPAIRLGAGVQVEEAYVAARAHGFIVVGGDCATVGVVGGYIQGGGHSALSSKYGLAADQAVEWEVVDGTGRLLKATPSQNADMYWALSGGGGGTYGIVLSVVLKLHPDMPVTGAQLRFNLDRGRPEAFHSAVSKYHELVPKITAAGGMGIAELTNDTFLLTPLTLPNLSRTDAWEILAPLVEQLEHQGPAYSLNVSEHPNWLDYWQKLIKPNPTQLVQNAQYGGWMVPRSVLEHNPEELTSAIQEITDAGCVFVGLALNVSRAEGRLTENSVLPAWRETALNVILSTQWPEGADPQRAQELAHIMTQICVPALSRLAPQTGAYMSEADPNQPGWQKAFYGTNYGRLLDIKRKYDPDHVFYAPLAVGSDTQFVDDSGRLCRQLHRNATSSSRSCD